MSKNTNRKIKHLNRAIKTLRTTEKESFAVEVNNMLLKERLQVAFKILRKKM